MNEDKAIHPKDLPQQRQDADTKQAEEFIDKSSTRKDEGDRPVKDVGRQTDADAPQPRNQ